MRAMSVAVSPVAAWWILRLLVLPLLGASSYVIPPWIQCQRQQHFRGSSPSARTTKISVQEWETFRHLKPHSLSSRSGEEDKDEAATAALATRTEEASSGSDVLHESERQLRTWDAWNPYRSQLLESDEAWDDFNERIRTVNRNLVKARGATTNVNGDTSTSSHLSRGVADNSDDSIDDAGFFDPFWEQIKLEASVALQQEPEAGPVLYQSVLLQPGLLVAVASLIANEIETELFRAPALKSLFLEQLTMEDCASVRLDLVASATRSPSAEIAPFAALDALLHHNGFHALVCYRVGHRLWQAGRTALAYYMQSAVSRKYAADIHPSCRLGKGTFLTVGGGVVIGETAVVGNDACILEGVTLGGTGKEAGDRHPKVGNGVVIQDGGTVLGNIPVGDGALITAKSIVTKPVPPLAIVSGVPARIQGYRQLTEIEFDDDLQRHLADKYLDEWKLQYGSSSPSEI
jgi:serine O-acetyltransferase